MYTFLLLIRVISSVMEQVLVSGLPIADAGRLFVTALPHVVVLTIPMSFLFGVLVALGRMSSDNELLAIQAGGRSVRALLRPVLLLALALTAFNAALTLFVMPDANRQQREEKVRLYASSAIIRQIQPRVFYDDFPNLLLYIRDKDPQTGTWKNVVLFDRSTPSERRLLVAERGRLIGDDAAVNTPSQHQAGAQSSPWLQLEEVTTHHFSRNEPEKYRLSVNRTQLVKLWTVDRPQVSFTFSLQERTTAELLEELDQPLSSEASADAREDRTLVLVELHKRLAIPAANIVFALLALPLGIGTRSGSRGRGVTISVLVIVLYYILLNHGELIAREGTVPAWFGVWLPNGLLFVVTLPMLLRMGRWLGERRPPFARVRRWLFIRRRASEVARASASSVGMPTLHQPLREPWRLRFPILLDRYILMRLLPPVIAVLVTALALSTALDLADKLDDLAENDVSNAVVFGYYWNMMPRVFVEVTPLALLMAVLIALAMLERNHELTALKAAGLSLYRIVTPILLAAVFAVGAVLIVNEAVVPEASRKRERLEDTIKARSSEGPSPTGLTTADRQWLFSRDGSRLYNFLGYDPTETKMLRVTMFRFDRRHALRFHLTADVVRFADGAWIAESGWLRQVFPDGSTYFRRFERPLELAITEAPDYFGRDFRTADEMSFFELRRYIEAMTSSGYSPTHLKVRWHQKITAPLSALVLVLIALPFGLNRSGGRRFSTMQGIALALALGIAYNLVLEGLAKAATAGYLPAALGAWAPLAIGLLFGLNRLTTLRT